ncbi:MAG: NAD(P)H-dependent oxidoreductase [Paludibacteraceae bacterium]
MNIIEILKWRYATKRMTGKIIPQNQIDEILETVRLAPSAYGLEPYKVIVTANKQLIQKIFEESCPQIVLCQCSHLLIFKTMKTLSQEYIETYLNRMKETRNYTDEAVKSYKEKIDALIQRTGTDFTNWSSHQTYIAMGYATIAAANLQIDATPIEGFNPKTLDKLLQLDTQKEGTTLLLTLGYRDTENDHLLKYPKIRKPLNELIEIL